MYLKTKKPSKTTKKRRLQYYLEGLMFLSPWLIGLIVFFAYPLFSSFYMSFNQIHTLMKYKLSWVGLYNYKQILFFNTSYIPLFWQSALNTVIFVPTIVLLSMILSIILNSKIAFRGLFRSIFFLPVLLGTGYIMKQLLGSGVDAKTMEVVNGILLPQNISNMLNHEVVSAISKVLGSITFILWKSGVQIIIFLAGLQSIPGSIYESAKVDSASAWEIFWKITMPMLAPFTVLTLIYTIINSFTDLTNPLIDYILTVSKNQAELTNAAAMSWLYLLFVIVILIFVLLFSRKYAESAYND